MGNRVQSHLPDDQNGKVTFTGVYVIKFRPLRHAPRTAWSSIIVTGVAELRRRRRWSIFYP